VESRDFGAAERWPAALWRTETSDPQLTDKVLTERLADLRESGLIEPGDGKRGGGYRLSARGESLRPILQALYDWGSAQAGALVSIGPRR
jgi:DNA-binding HxlR family transcriptional regulator